MRSRHGFSLIELLVVIVLIGIVGGVSMPRFSRIITQTKVHKAAQVLAIDVQQAFAIAGRNRRPIRLVWSSADMQMQVTDRAQTTVFRRTGVGAGAGFNLTSEDVTVYPTVLEIYPNGLALDTLYIKVAKSGHSRIIRVSKAGVVRTQ